jgi:rhodanese-related sulfurtransferase/glyoxylase-like metal-dependent hydrolase (beta-lactamase superfamily II)
LANKTGATIVYGPTAAPSFPAHIAKDGEELKLGNVTFQVLHTPGHTLESSCFLLKDEQGKEVALFSGDTLFIGDVGRPDLAQKAAHMTQEELAGLLYDSLQKKILPLPDDVIVYPAHGAGSACGKKMSSETTDTLGHQKATNYALRPELTKEQFIKEVVTGLMPPPGYFPANVMLNKMGYESIDEVLKRGAQPLSPDMFETIASETGALMLDTRNAQDFAKGFIPNSINIGIDGNFAPWVGALIPDIQQKILIIADPGREQEVITRLARVGFDNTLGYLQGGFEAWKAAGKETDSIISISPEEAAQKLKTENATILDVRKESEFNSQHIENATNAPLDYLNDSMLKVDKNKTYYVHCAGGYRSMIFTSALRARGYKNLIDIKGGFKAIKETNLFPLTEYKEPITEL